MGQAHRKSNQKLISTEEEEVTTLYFKLILSNKRSKIIEKIHKLHKISLFCKEGIENCVITNNKNIALVLRLKRFYLQNTLISLQILVKDLDTVLKITVNRTSIFKRLTKKVDQVLNVFNKLLDNNVELIVKGEKKVLKEIKSEIKRFSVFSIEVEEENEKEFLDAKKGVRRTYRRGIKTSL